MYNICMFNFFLYKCAQDPQTVLLNTYRHKYDIILYVSVDHLKRLAFHSLVKVPAPML